ncbi:MAG: hypothetical protein KDK78_06075 [Chlamydiia bacterium]|nr:hypothetical protein [Chlamydiia bacterium]
MIPDTVSARPRRKRPLEDDSYAPPPTRQCTELNRVKEALRDECIRLDRDPLWQSCRDSIDTVEKAAIFRCLLAQGKDPIDVHNLPSISDLLAPARRAVHTTRRLSWGRRQLKTSAILSVALAKLLITASGEVNQQLLVLLRENEFIQKSYPEGSVYKDFSYAALFHIETGFSERLENCTQPCQEAEGLIRDILDIDACVQLGPYHTRVAILSALLSTPRQLPNIPSCYAAAVHIRSHLGARQLLRTLEDYKDLLEKGYIIRGKDSQRLQHHQFSHEQNLLSVALEMTIASMSRSEHHPLLRTKRLVTQPVSEIIERIIKEHKHPDLQDSKPIIDLFQRHIDGHFLNRARFDIWNPDVKEDGTWILEARSTHEVIQSSAQLRSAFHRIWDRTVKGVDAPTRAHRYFRLSLRREVPSFFESPRLDGDPESKRTPWMGELGGHVEDLVEIKENSYENMSIRARDSVFLLKELLDLDYRSGGMLASIPEHCIVIRTDILQDELRKHNGSRDALLSDLEKRGKEAAKDCKVTHTDIDSLCRAIPQLERSGLESITNLEELGQELRRQLRSTDPKEMPQIELKLYHAVDSYRLLPFIIFADSNYHFDCYICFARSPLLGTLAPYFVRDRHGETFAPLDWAISGPTASSWSILDIKED